MTQTFTLSAGWNAIYLSVEPMNPSPLVNQGTAEQPQWVHEKSMMEAVFGPLVASGALESVWTYNQPVSHKDYIVDPGEGLWDAPGWLYYIPKGKPGSGDTSLTNLVSLHTNTGYLVKLKDKTSGTVQVAGRPVPGHHRWGTGPYNLAGFPMLPGGGATVGAMKTASPITEVRALTPQGEWQKLADTVMLQYGQSYLVYYGNPGVSGRQNFTAPLDMDSAPAGAGVPSEGLEFQAGMLGQKTEPAGQKRQPRRRSA